MAILLLVSGVLGPLLGGAVADLCQRVGGPRLTTAALTGLTLISVPAGLFAVAPGEISTVASLLIFMTIGSAIGVIVTTLYTIIIPNEVRGLCLSSLWTTGALLGLGVAPMAVSVLSSTMGGPSKIGAALATVCVSSSALGAGAFALGRRHIPANTRTSPLLARSEQK